MSGSVSLDFDSLDFRDNGGNIQVQLQNSGASHLTVNGASSNVVLLSNVAVATRQTTVSATTYTVVSNDEIMFSTHADATTITLLAVASARQHILTFYRNATSNSLTIAASGSEKIDNNQTTVTVAPYASRRLVHNGTQWFTV